MSRSDLIATAAKWSRANYLLLNRRPILAQWLFYKRIERHVCERQGKCVNTRETVLLFNSLRNPESWRINNNFLPLPRGSVRDHSIFLCFIFSYEWLVNFTLSIFRKYVIVLLAEEVGWSPSRTGGGGGGEGGIQKPQLLSDNRSQQSTIQSVTWVLCLLITQQVEYKMISDNWTEICDFGWGHPVVF